MNPPGATPVLYYHSIADNRVSVSPRAFRAQLAYLKQRGYRCTGIGEWLDRPQGAHEKPVVLTFDDGFACMHENVLPILNEFGFRATFFIVPGYVGTTLWGDPVTGRWSREPSPGRVACPVMCWEQVLGLHRAGMEIGSHTLSHRNLTDLPEQDARREVTESRRVLEQMLATRVRGFSYPRGCVTQALAHLVQESGYDYACTTQPGDLSSAMHRFLLPRVPGPSTVSELFFQVNRIAANPWTRSALRLARYVETRRRAADATP